MNTVATADTIEILGVNGDGQDADNPLAVAGRVLPWLQDTPEANVYRSWQVVYRDVIVLDGENRVVRIYNLTEHTLADSANYNELRTVLLNAAGPPPIAR